MSAAFFIVLDKKEPGFDAFVNGKFLSQDSNRIDKIANSLGIPKLDDYVSYAPEEARAMMEDMGMDPEEIDNVPAAEQKWFDAQEGLDWVAKVVAHIQANPSAVKNAKCVLGDLQEYQGVF